MTTSEIKDRMKDKLRAGSIVATISRAMHPRGARAGSLRDRVRVLLGYAIDCGILSTLFVAPLFLGGRHDMGRLVLVCIIAFTVTCWTMRKLMQKTVQWPWTGLEWVAAASIALLSLQLTPLSNALLTSISPSTLELLPTWNPQSNSAVNFGSWEHLSLAPELTRGAIVMLTSYWLLFFVVADHLRKLADVQRMLKWIALAAVSMAVIGILQRFFGNGKFLWIYEHPNRHTLTAVKGTFTNENHFAHFLALGIAPLILWIRSSMSAGKESTSSRRSRRKPADTKSQYRNVLLIAGLCIVLFAGLLSFSRGGVIVVFLTSAIAVLGLSWIGLLGRRAVLGVGLAASVVAAAIFIFGHQPLMDEMQTIERAQSLSDLCAGRVKLWGGMLSASSAFPLFGTGAGSHLDVYPAFLDQPPGVQFSHGESGFIQIALETGIVGILVLCSLIGTLMYYVTRWFMRGPDKAAMACMIVTVAGLAASIVHSIFDFVWYIPACFTMTVVLLAVACRIPRLNESSHIETNRSPVGYPFALSVGVGVLVLCGILIQQRIGPGMASYSWDKYYALSKRAGGEERKGFAARNDDESDYLASEFRLRQMKRYLSETLRWDPNNSRAMLRLAALDMRQFQQQQASLTESLPLEQIADAANNSEFPSKAARDEWLANVLGNRMGLLKRAAILSERSLRLSPLEGRGYLLLAESGQLSQWQDEQLVALFNQAKQVRPFDELVLYKNGIEKLRSGNVDDAMEVWKEAFPKSPEIRSLVINALAPVYTAEQLTELLQNDRESLYRLYAHYKSLGQTTDATFIAEPLAKMIESSAQKESSRDAADLFNQAGNVYAHLEMYDDAVRCLRKSTQLSPNNFSFHFALAGRLVQAERLDEAVAEYLWCRRRQPKNEAVEAQLESAYKMAVTSTKSITR
ncbi:MAG: hypothetical protein HKN47_03025 [Pirellulaceae bacterium]|nr:hypothetical protein [Pirellulaceae bacterium]